MRVVSLFSGCGGMDLGFKQAGFDIIWANDFDKDAQRVYAENLGEIDPRDIRNIPTDEIPNCEVITAGFPCQPFSNAGNRKGLNDYRGTLFMECLRIIEQRQPLAVVFENVKGILSIRDNYGMRLIDIINYELDKMLPGYYMTYQLLNASDYGVPQNRERVFMVAIRKDVGTSFIFPEKLPKKGLEVKYIIDNSMPAKNQVHWKLSPQAQKMVAYIPEGGSWKDIPYEVLPERFKKIRDNMQKYRSPNFYRRFSRDEINGTITASAQPENCGILHPLEDRRYTIREVARIQSFPEDFVFFDDTIPKMYKVIGNAVPPKLAYAVANQLRKILCNETNVLTKTMMKRF